MNKFIENIAHAAVNNFGSVKTVLVAASTVCGATVGFIGSTILIPNNPEVIDSIEEEIQNEEN